MRRSTAIRATAWGIVAAGVIAPLVRKKVKAPPLATQAIAFAAPLGLCVAMPRSRTRDVATCGLQMWAYLAAYKSPHDNEDAQRERVLIKYPIAIDRVLGAGQLPTRRLQRTLAKCGPQGAEWTTLDKVLVWNHWIWFAVPHSALAYLLMRHPERFPRAAVMTYAVFDLGAMVYWLLPTAPPWYAAADAVNGFNRQPEIRRMMVEYGESFWKDGWGPLYSVLGGNPLAAMPSLHFATSVMAALLLSEAEPLAGAVGWSYAITLGFALVYLGEHYVIDLIAGGALTMGVKKLGPVAGPAINRFAGVVAALEAKAHGP